MRCRGLFVTLALAFAVDASGTDYCFGAVGQQCGSISIEQVTFAACVPFIYSPRLKVCAVSAGSMTHDPCCADRPYGKMCGRSPENQSQCLSEWNRAVHRFVWGYQWLRVVDPTIPNTSGNVVRENYLPPGMGVLRNTFSPGGRATGVTHTRCRRRTGAATWPSRVN